MKGAQGKHDRTIDWLIMRLGNKGYENVTRNFEYGTPPIIAGECDLIALRRGWIHYYEVKSNDVPEAYQRALRQFRNFRMHFDGLNIQTIYVTPTSIRRVSPCEFPTRTNKGQQY